MLTSANNRNDYVGNGATDTYPYTFRIFSNTDILATVRDTDNVETTLVLTTDYTVDGVGEVGGGDVVLVNSGQDWLDADGDLLSGYALTIRRVLPLTQESDIRNQGDFYPETHEDQFDFCVAIDQQQQDEIDRSVKLPETVSADDFDPTLPVPSASKLLAMNSAADAFELVDPGTDFTYPGNFNAGLDAAKNSNPTVKDVYLATDTKILYACFTNGAWTTIANDVADDDAGYFKYSSVSIKTDNYTVLSADLGKLMIMNAGTAKAFTLPAISSNANKVLITLSIGAGTLTLTPNGSDTIDKGTLTQNQCAIHVSDSANTKWRCISFQPNVTFPTGTIVGTSDTQTLTNKRITPRVFSETSNATPATNSDSYDQHNITALAAAAAIGAPTGTPTDGQRLIYRIKDNGTSRALTWNAAFRAIGITLPTTTVVSKTVYVGCIYNSADSKWDAIATAQEA